MVWVATHNALVLTFDLFVIFIGVELWSGWQRFDLTLPLSISLRWRGVG